MCGITGIIDKKIGELEPTIREMTRCITHRGPDDDGFYIDRNVALGMRRLSIIDLKGGHQPITSRDGRYLIIFNGEIYNYKELKGELLQAGEQFETQSDTEVVLRMFEREGGETFKQLRGMFALAIYDTLECKLTLARDIFGIKPLYYYKSGERIEAFSSEIKSFLKIPGFNKVVNDRAVYHYLSYQYNPLEETFFKGVYKFSPGHFMTVDVRSGLGEKQSYFNFKFTPDDTLEEEKTKKKILEMMEDSVAHHMIADVPVGAFLSGGIDSSIIATLMSRGSPSGRKVKTFTVGFTSLSEAKEARETSEPLGTDHTEISVSADEYFEALPKVVWHFDEPVADPSALGLYFLAREARKSVKVVLSGEGSDELFGGYNIYLAPIVAKRLAWLPKGVLRFLSRLPLRGSNFATRGLLKLEDWYIGNAFVFKNKELADLWLGDEMSKTVFDIKSLFKEVEGQSDSTKMQYIDINTWLVGDILAKADKMTMAHSLELRVPFLDIEVAKLAVTLPNRFKWRRGVTKYLLREAFRSILPESTRNRRKLGFPTPVGEWFTPERTWIAKLVLENEYVKSHFDLKIIEQLFKNHFEKKVDNSRKIYLLLVLAIWYNTFITEIT